MKMKMVGHLIRKFRNPGERGYSVMEGGTDKAKLYDPKNLIMPKIKHKESPTAQNVTPPKVL